MKLTDFARQYNISDRHARRLFSENKADIDGHYQRRGKAGTDIDDWAVEYLAHKLQKMNDVVIMTPYERDIKDKINQLMQYNAQLANEKAAALEKLVDAERRASEGAGAILLLEAAKEDKAVLQGRVERAEARAEQADQERRESEERARARERELEDKANNLQKQLNAEIQRNRDLRNTPLWKRIFNWK